MKKIIFLAFFSLILSGCGYAIVNNYKLEKYNNSEMPVCVNYAQRLKVVKPSLSYLDDCGNKKIKPAKYKSSYRQCDVFEPEVVSYSYCLENLPKPVHLVEKQVGDMTICYDRNNGIELPILYCQKDTVNIAVQKTVVKNSNQVLIK